jgi:hypothetical protein
MQALQTKDKEIFDYNFGEKPKNSA